MIKICAKVRLQDGRLLLSGRGMGWIKENGWFVAYDLTKKDGIRD